MGKINVLDKNVAELIAAGEVIERPASIVKELLENAIDAGSTAVTVEIRRGGISYIRVTDNGSGILPEDVPAAFLRHATSKLRLSDDLNFISTLGFRGEALASIAAVSRLELTSKTREHPFGTAILLEGGEQVSLSEAGCPDGTTIQVRDLFYNVPARLKFLRRDQSEANTVGGVVDRLALSHPEISFKFLSDHKLRLHTPGDGKLLSAIHAVFGGDFSSALLPVDYGCGGVSVKGYTSSASSSRANRSMEHFFVNSRYIRSKLCAAALEEGYKNSLMTGKYPFCVLNVELPFEQVDVNVHPAKTEVRFADGGAVTNAVYFAVKSALSQEDVLRAAREEAGRAQRIPNLLSKFKSQEAEQSRIPLSPRPSSEEERPYAAAPAHRPVILRDRQAEPLREEPPVPPSAPEEAEEEYQFIRPAPPPPPAPAAPEPPHPPERLREKGITFVPEPPAVPEEAASPEEPPLEVRVIGEAFRTYVIFEAEGTLFLLDKHAAHERLLFERLKRSVATDQRQILLKPAVVHVSPEENQALEEHRSLLEGMGFVYEEFGNNALIVREVPLVLAECDPAELLLDTAGKLIAGKRDVSSDAYERLLHSMACRSAIKAGDETSLEELAELLRMVYANGEIRHCPHGRPVAAALTRREIEKLFGRIQ